MCARIAKQTTCYRKRRRRGKETFEIDAAGCGIAKSQESVGFLSNVDFYGSGRAGVSGPLEGVL